jgi:hypothetical protein
LKNIPLDWRTLLGAAGVLVVAVAIGIYSWRRRPRDPDEIERRRRSYLNQVGRIVEGQVIEIIETPEPAKKSGTGSGLFARQKASTANGGHATRKLVCYSYSISGVSYETAQDITGLEERACLEVVAAGQPASVKYDPANPGNSILIADDWSGLH